MNNIYISKDDLYRHLQGDTYQNLRTKAIGVIDSELANRVLKINLDATGIINKYPMIATMIEKLSLKIEINNND